MRHAVVCSVLAAVILAIYGQTHKFDFVNFDDNVYLLENPRIEDGLTMDNVAWAFTTGHHANWHPLTWLSYLLDAEWSGLSAPAFHVTNVAFHLLATFSLYAFLFYATGNGVCSFLVSALFAIHPLHVESVAWISERKDVLSASLWFLASLNYVIYVRQSSRGAFAGAVVFFVLGLMAKPMLVTLPMVLLLFDYWPLERKQPFRSLVLEKAPFFALAAASAVITVWVQRGAESVQPFSTIPLSERLGNAAIAYIIYLKKTVWPTDLAFFYPHPRDSLVVWEVVGAFFVLVAITAVSYRFRRNAPYGCVGWVWYLVTLLPVIGIVQVGGQAMADRYTYIPLVGVFIAVVWGVRDVVRAYPNYRPVAIASTAVLMGTFGLVAYWQTATWRNTETLCLRALAVTRENVLAHQVLGMYYLDEGRLDEAEAQLGAALAINPTFTGAALNLSQVLILQGRPGDAAALLRDTAARTPDDARVRYTLARALAGAGDLGGAQEHFAAALAIRPRDALIRTAYGNVLARLGRYDEAVAEYQRAIADDPGYVLAYVNLAAAHIERGDAGAARAALDKALELDPGNATAIEMSTRLRN